MRLPQIRSILRCFFLFHALSLPPPAHSHACGLCSLIDDDDNSKFSSLVLLLSSSSSSSFHRFCRVSNSHAQFDWWLLTVLYMMNFSFHWHYTLTMCFPREWIQSARKTHARCHSIAIIFIIKCIGMSCVYLNLPRSSISLIIYLLTARCCKHSKHSIIILFALLSLFSICF